METSVDFSLVLPTFPGVYVIDHEYLTSERRGNLTSSLGDANIRLTLFFLNFDFWCKASGTSLVSGSCISSLGLCNRVINSSIPQKSEYIKPCVFSSLV